LTGRYFYETNKFVAYIFESYRPAVVASGVDSLPDQSDDTVANHACKLHWSVAAEGPWCLLS